MADEQKMAEMYGTLNADGELTVNFKVGLGTQIARQSFWARLLLGDSQKDLALYEDSSGPILHTFGEGLFDGTDFSSNVSATLAPIYIGNSPYSAFAAQLGNSLSVYQRNQAAMRRRVAEMKAEDIVSEWATLPTGYHLPDSFEMDAGILTLPEDYVMTEFAGMSTVSIADGQVYIDYVTMTYIPKSQALLPDPANFWPHGSQTSDIRGGMFGFDAAMGRQRGEQGGSILYESIGASHAFTQLFFRVPRNGYIPTLGSPHSYEILRARDATLTYAQYLRYYNVGWYEVLAPESTTLPSPPFVYDYATFTQAWPPGTDPWWRRDVSGALWNDFSGGGVLIYPTQMESFGLSTGVKPFIWTGLPMSLTGGLTLLMTGMPSPLAPMLAGQIFQGRRL